MASLPAVIGEMTTALEPLSAEIDGLQVYGYWNDTPTPPALDIYPATPFQDPAAFGTENTIYLTVRARVLMADPTSGQTALLRLLDPDDAASVEDALAGINGRSYTVAECSGYSVYADDAPVNERMLGCEWRVQTFL